MSNPNPESSQIIEELKALATPEKAKKAAYFFKTGKGEYGEGDQFIGITNPENRKVAKKYFHVGFPVIEALLASPIHEVRMCGSMILVIKFERSKKIPDIQKAVVNFYLQHIRAFNNWDLVDLSCYKILGAWLKDRDKSLLYTLAKSENLWKQRIAIISTMSFIKNDDFNTTLELSEYLLHHPHDLMHKAVGWMLREIGKRDLKTEEVFLQQHYKSMPRTMLRYAIEKFPENNRQAYLKGTK